MKEKFTWISIYRKLVLKVLEYENKEEELIAIIRDIQRSIERKEYDKDRIDPLSFLNILDLYESEKEKRRDIFIEKFERATNMAIEIPDYTGLPHTIRNHCISVDKESSDYLWELTHAAIDYDNAKTELNKEKFIEAYNKASNKIDKGNNHRIPNNLYKLCPNLFICLADPDRKLLNNDLHINFSNYKTGEGYLDLCKEVKEKMKPLGFQSFYELSASAWNKYNEEEEIRSDSNSMNYFLCISNAKKQNFSFLMLKEGNIIDYEEEKRNQYPSNLKKDDLVIGYDTTIDKYRMAVSINIVVDVINKEDKRIIRIKKLKNLAKPVMYYDEIKKDNDIGKIFLKDNGLSHGAFSIKEISEKQYNKFIELSKKVNNVNIEKIKEEISKYLLIGFNRIYYGVPGCGKSFYIGNNIEEVIGLPKEKTIPKQNIIRTVFYPDYTNSDFVGQIMPLTESTDSEKIKYKPIPGPFTKALLLACNTKDAVVLIIEEINRGNAAAIFGDIFQLLDRSDDTNGIYNAFIEQYALYTKNEKLEEFIKDGFKLPDNLFIIATMNTSDQNVYVLDTAFQRRWDKKYYSNRFVSNDDKKMGELLIPNSENVTWEQFVTKINNEILDKRNNIIDGEDKQIGKYFVKKDILIKKEELIKNKEKFEMFRDKVLVYLFEDVVKYNPYSLFHEDIKCLDDIMSKDTLEKIIKVDFNNE